MKKISIALKALGLYLTGILAVMLIYVLLSSVDQGIDVVIQMGEYIRVSAWSIVSIIFWTYLVWYSSRSLSYRKQLKEITLKEEDKIPDWYHRHIPRLLAINCFASIQYAIICLPTFTDVFPFNRRSGLLLLIVLLTHTLLYFSLADWYSRAKGKEKPKLVFSIIFILANAALWLYLLFASRVPYTALFTDPRRHKFWLPVIGLMLLVFEVVMVYLFEIRRKRIDTIMNGLRKEHPGETDPSLFIMAENTYKLRFTIVVFIAIIVYFWAMFSMSLADQFGPLAFTLLATGILVGLFNLITRISVKYSVNFSFILLFLAIILGFRHNPYIVRLNENHDPSKINLHQKRPSVEAYFKTWLAQPRRKRLLDSCVANNKKFDVYMVLSNGGASRAGDWVSTVMSRLQDESKNRFSDHLLSMAGASGGSVGNCAFYSLLKAHKDKVLKENEKFLPHDSAFFNSDFLTYTLGRFLGLDFFRHFFSFSIFDDRSAALANVMATKAEDPIVEMYFNKDVDSVFDTSGELPFFFINTTRVEDGMPGVISVTQCPNPTKRLDILTLVDTFGRSAEGRSLNLSTAAVLSSRFPYVSPAGKIGNSYFVDGGYFDNSGAGITLDLIQEIHSLLADSMRHSDSLFRKYSKVFCFHLLHLYNSPVTTPPWGDMHPLVNDLFTPMIALAGIQNASTNVGDAELQKYLYPQLKDSLYIEFSLYNRFLPKNAPPEQDFPMSWVTSDYQLWRMSKGLNREDSVNAPMFKNIMKP